MIQPEQNRQLVSKDKNDVSFSPEEPKYDLDDIVLPVYVKEQILDVAEYMHNSKIVFEDWGLETTHKYSKRMGINLYGPPGTGKTMAAHAIAKHLKRKILVVNYADIESKYVGDTPKNIRKAFEAAKETNSVIFFDEADAILSKRVTNMLNATDVSVNQTRSVMLMILNDYQDIIIFATNFIENFDPAFMRRIAKHVKFELPDEICRQKLWDMYIPDRMPNDIDIMQLAHKYNGISGSDISNAILMAAFKAARNKLDSVSQKSVEETIEGIIDSKHANERVTVEKRIVSEKYVKKQLNNNG
ncbi:ATPase AAA [Anaerovibrio lipolyticus]|uniref:ATPase AAA n=1 Tax=Anaerovibrio lipolyticus TaxID=82374 RepID=A0A0B2JSY7_9FIRM|nr:ATPase AAA [Anaerovibrio lipolyticus]